MTGVIAVIPARGGSKRILKKNIKPLMGKPMLAWTIEAAMASGCFDRIVVSTDCEEIAAVAASYGNEIPLHRDNYADDFSSVSQATAYVLEQIEAKGKYTKVAQLMPNCPLRNAEDIRKAISDFDEGNREFQISCFRYGWMNPWWAATLNEDGQPTPLYPEGYEKRSQDLPELYCPTGAIWLANVERLLETRDFYGDGHCFCELPWQSALDIDDMNDWQMAEAFMNAKNTVGS